MTDNIINYSPEFQDLIVDFHKGKEQLTYYKDSVADHLGGPNSRLSHFLKHLFPEISHFYGDLDSKRVLDFGCGTGATTVMLALHCKNVVAFDINEKSINICKRRLAEHGLSDRVTFFCAKDIGLISGQMGKYDFILSNAVFQNIPLSKAGLRAGIIQTLFEMLNEKGCLYINETANRLWPKDGNTTKLWWIPWTKPGSKWAYDQAIKKGRHCENPSTHSNGPLGLEERGAWGVTFFELKKYLKGRSFEIVNLLPGYNKHISYVNGVSGRRFFEFIIYWSFLKIGKIPITAISPSLRNLVIRRVM